MGINFRFHKKLNHAIVDLEWNHEDTELPRSYKKTVVFDVTEFQACKF